MGMILDPHKRERGATRRGDRGWTDARKPPQARESGQCSEAGKKSQKSVLPRHLQKEPINALILAGRPHSDSVASQEWERKESPGSRPLVPAAREAHTRSGERVSEKLFRISVHVTPSPAP